MARAVVSSVKGGWICEEGSWREHVRLARAPPGMQPVCVHVRRCACRKVVPLAFLGSDGYGEAAHVYMRARAEGQCSLLFQLGPATWMKPYF